LYIHLHHMIHLHSSLLLHYTTKNLAPKA